MNSRSKEQLAYSAKGRTKTAGDGAQHGLYTCRQRSRAQCKHLRSRAMNPMMEAFARDSPCSVGWEKPFALPIRRECQKPFAERVAV